MKNLENNIIGIDLGGTKVNIGLVQNNKILSSKKQKLPKNCKDEWDVLNLIIELTKEVIGAHKITGIGVGVPSILDREKGIIHEVQNIPTWHEVHLAAILNKEFNVPVFIDNDANCFALGEYYFGEGKNCSNFVGLTLGTGMGAGIITNNKLMGDANGGSGEFGMIPYKNGVIEDYCSGKFFKNIIKVNGEENSIAAAKGNIDALKSYEIFGEHLANAIKTILYAIDPEKIIIGGSIVQSATYFDESLKKHLSNFAYKKTLQNIEIIYSDTPNIAVLGAAALVY
ncbi:ROK family protein [Lutibacter holmesii]|uniref:ROK family protein n=1 Tax=Lutibacter holmesii TaxID=1137985 RepID=A0ABW3WS53_9FLAO